MIVFFTNDRIEIAEDKEDLSTINKKLKEEYKDAKDKSKTINDGRRQQNK